MDKMPYRPTTQQLDMSVSVAAVASWQASPPDWREGLPALASEKVMVRDVRLPDAPSLLAMLNTEEVSRFVSPPPATVEGFERFILWSHRQRAEGAHACFAVVPSGFEHAMGVIQLRQLEPDFRTAEWGASLGSPFWGTGVFSEAAHLVLDFVFDTLGVHRLEARAAVPNGRGNGALRKLGAVQEGVLRRSLLRNGQYLDQVLWTILDEDWRLAKAGWTPRIH